MSWLRRWRVLNSGGKVMVITLSTNSAVATPLWPLGCKLTCYRSVPDFVSSCLWSRVNSGVLTSPIWIGTRWWTLGRICTTLWSRWARVSRSLSLKTVHCGPVSLDCLTTGKQLATPGIWGQCVVLGYIKMHNRPERNTKYYRFMLVGCKSPSVS